MKHHLRVASALKFSDLTPLEGTRDNNGPKLIHHQLNELINIGELARSAEDEDRS